MLGVLESSVLPTVEEDIATVLKSPENKYEQCKKGAARRGAGAWIKATHGICTEPRNIIFCVFDLYNEFLVKWYAVA